ncbi:type IV toxin-antitoxin system AbiEi family antitoxin [Moheibacter stercoris]|uniref:Transcriptional regulator AbiEi antitoxin N-terminal domain-containing protein n=1 Tax=Moheibacter stercoris TaxID=1628251 RepID=A0ABV2LPL5_9FLAO
MSSLNPTKINYLLQQVPVGVAMASSWLSKQGYSPDLIRSYRKSQWLESLGNGAVKRISDEVDYLGAVYCLQKQLEQSVYPAAKTALILQGRSHYLEMDEQQVYLFGSEKETLPTWFKNQNWKPKIQFYTSSFLPESLAMTQIVHKNFEVSVSTPARALMECLYLAPKEMNLVECYELMEGLNDLVPTQVQQLLEQCTSVKVKRLFLYLAEKSNHSWLKYVNKEKIDLGAGNRSLVKNGVYISKYKITVPKELEEDGLPEI